MCHAPRLWFLQLVAAVIAALVVPVAGGASAQSEPLPTPEAGVMLANLRPAHPRLLASSNDFIRLRAQVRSDATLRGWHDTMRRHATKLLKEPPSKYEIPDGLRLLSTSRRVLDRVYTLALCFRIGGDPLYAQRAWAELEAAAAFPDWNPKHFLDTAEMTHAFAIGYDWLYDVWTPSQREELRRAIVEKGLRLGVESYRGRPAYGWWTHAHHNWNQVCNGGIGMGALALADVEPELAGEFLGHAVQSIQFAMREYGPDGAWAEGPGYWSYATSYNVVFLAALQTALGSDFGLATIPGFAAAGLFPIYVTGPLGKTFNYADGSDGTIRSPAMFWLARQFNQPAYAQYERGVAGPGPLDLVWFDAALASGRADLPLDRYFRSAEVTTFRSAWDDREALFVGFKAGDNQANHSNLDLGSFVLDALGVRWVVDLGADNYNLPGYFGSQRWDYYRLRAEGHNTLLVDPGSGPDQDPQASATITRFEPSATDPGAIADLTPAYAKVANHVWRRVSLPARRQVLLQDAVELKRPGDIWWFLHTRAELTLTDGGRGATFTQDGKRLVARLLTPENAVFTVRDAVPLASSPQPAEQNPNRGIRKLAIALPQTKALQLAVLLTPLRPGDKEPANMPAIAPLDPP